MSTHVSPAADDVVDVVPAEAEVHDALVDGLAAAVGRQVRLGDLHPAERADGEPHAASVTGLRLGPRRETLPPAETGRPVGPGVRHRQSRTVREGRR